MYISEFVSGGPKNCVYKLYNSAICEVKSVCKVRGITLYYKALQLVNFDMIKYLLLNGISANAVRVRTVKKIKRKRGDGTCVSIVTEPDDNFYRVSFSSGIGKTITRSLRSGIDMQVAWRGRHFD